MRTAGEDSEARVAAAAFRADLPGQQAGWTTNPGALEQVVQHWKIVVMLTKGDRVTTFDAYVWSRARVGLMDPETSASIAVTSMIEHIDVKL